MTGRRYSTIFESRSRMHVLVTVEDTGNMTEAAQLLGMTQPSVSRVIASLEKIVGARLFKRRSLGRPGVQPTTIGIIAAHRARVILCEMDEAERAIFEARDILDEPGREDEG